MVLQTLDSMGPQHGYAIASRIEQVSGGALQLNMGTLYPGLMRLEQRGLVRGSWGTTEANRKARFYTLTAAGRRELAKEKQAWDRMTTIMQALLRGEAWASIMRVLREWSHRIAGTLLRRRRDDDLEEEIRIHLELTADEAQRRGQTPHEALRTARLRSGGA